MARLIRLLNTRATRTIILAFLILLCLLTKPVCVDPKGAPTDFSCLPDFSEWPSNIQLPRQLVRRQQGSSALDIDDRYLFVRELGSGREGIVRLYWDTSTGDSVAIKAFHSKYRNPVPARVFEALKAENVHYWPTEIQATILLGVSTLRNDDTGSSPKCGVETWSLDMLLALDYFLVHGTPLPSATILAKGRLPIWQKSLEVENQTFNDLDLSLRPTLHRFLGSLARMHKIGLVRKAW
ncbi:MAG: hypothetical protein LQ343_002614 [Gyalolechia ehrenbergii]|nr:MAG: hypothetical protein LQ343_002614 [Gyalolechia ehrenbergii]